MIKLNDKGQALVEYLLIIAVISVLVISIVKLLGGYLQDSMTKSSCALVDKIYVEGEKPGEGRCVDKWYSSIIFFLLNHYNFDIILVWYKDVIRCIKIKGKH